MRSVCGRAAGSYSPSGCSQSSCCCLTAATIAQSGPASFSLTGPVAGQCGSMTTATAAVATATADSATYSLAGETHTATRNPSTGSISDANARSSNCDSLLTKSSSDSSSVMTVGLFWDSACSYPMGVVQQTKGACRSRQVLDEPAFVQGSCAGDQWTVRGFASRTCSGTAAFEASGSGRAECVPDKGRVGVYVRAACDGSAFPVYDPSEWLGQCSAKAACHRFDPPSPGQPFVFFSRPAS